VKDISRPNIDNSALSPIVIDRDGDIFMHILFYLQYGFLPIAPTENDLPGIPKIEMNLEMLEKIQQEADYYLLKDLSKYCLKRIENPLEDAF
jgi:hydrogenase maturation factor HypF (carbamoyltransferase family)